MPCLPCSLVGRDGDLLGSLTFLALNEDILGTSLNAVDLPTSHILSPI